MTSSIQKFNQTFGELMDDIIRVVPDDPELRMYQLALQAALAFEGSMVQKVFHDKVAVPYGDKIIARDDTFFLTHTYDDITSQDSNASALIDKVKSYYAQISKEDQDTVWKYFKLLVLLDRKIANA